jgi:polysaccharide export outer membrane protein
MEIERGNILKNSMIALIVVVSMFAAGMTFADESQYHIGPGDVLEISVWRDESLVRDVVVPPDGTIAYPLAGDINVHGMTVSDLRRVVTKRLRDYVTDATVTVMIKEIRSLKAYVIGKVNNPGEFAINMDTSVMQILAMAKGLNPFASEKHIHVLRRQNNVTVVIPFNYKEVVKGKNLKQNILLQKGDVVVVP